MSRGELVEIGGDFRVPDVMAQTGTRLVEVGTTNRTRLADYERAITTETRLLVRVHTSNYRIVGFTSQPPLRELAELAHRSGLLFYEDAGSGALFDLRPYGLEGEPVIADSIRDGADVVSFSGDKLLGASQAGLVVGRRTLIESLRKHPLYRALRADKLALAALEATLDAHRRGVSFKEVPVLRMLALTREEIEARARALLSRLAERGHASSLHYEIIEGESAIGGGAAPLAHPRTALIALTHDKLTAAALEEALRSLEPPIIARIVDGRVLLDLRTVAEDEEATLLPVGSAQQLPSVPDGATRGVRGAAALRWTPLPTKCTWRQASPGKRPASGPWRGRRSHPRARNVATAATLTRSDRGPGGVLFLDPCGALPPVAHPCACTTGERAPPGGGGHCAVVRRRGAARRDV